MVPATVPSSALAIVHQHVGRRHRITRAEMAAMLLDLGIDLPAASTITGRDQQGRLHVGGAWIADPADEAAAVATEWSRLCHGITCISVLPMSYYVGDELREGLGVRYDEPGRMHPLRHAALTFVPEEAGADSIAYMRRHADRVLVVRADQPAANPRDLDLPVQWTHISNFGVRQCPHADAGGFVEYRQGFQTRIPADCWTEAETWIDEQEQRIEQWRAAG